MSVRWGRAAATAVLSLGCITLALLPQGAASASATSALRWSQPKSTGVSSGEEISSVSCPSTKFCAAVDASSRTLTFNGTKWNAPVSTGIPGDPLSSVSCPSAKFCVASAELVDVDYCRPSSTPAAPGTAPCHAHPPRSASRSTRTGWR